jgi:hypothetical protein
MHSGVTRREEFHLLLCQTAGCSWSALSVLSACVVCVRSPSASGSMPSSADTVGKRTHSALFELNSEITVPLDGQ